MEGEPLNESAKVYRSRRRVNRSSGCTSDFIATLQKFPFFVHGIVEGLKKINQDVITTHQIKRVNNATIPREELGENILQLNSKKKRDGFC